MEDQKEPPAGVVGQTMDAAVRVVELERERWTPDEAVAWRSHGNSSGVYAPGGARVSRVLGALRRNSGRIMVMRPARR
jgi:hypothetical protein